ncbi:hypothetical protein GCK32_013811 [Trichostrongylus colubriformis]|uniref:Legumain prodomain domain-containing protein n=1 Tax=Trichostrongylus colubriformis TaxID=6319 RepID=A0AAN8J0C9_TRICO
MHRNHKFGQLVFYLEACESGSMFEGILKNNINVYAVTAANGRESSYATYCDLYETMQLPCLGDEFSVNWMEDSDVTQHRRVSWPSRDVELMHLQKLKLLGHHSATIDAEIRRIHEDRRNIENVFTNLINNLVSDAAGRRSLLEERSSIKNLDCHDDVVKMFSLICVNVHKYDHALKYMYVLNNLCNKFDDSGKIIRAMRMICPGTRNQFI